MASPWDEELIQPGTGSLVPPPEAPFEKSGRWRGDWLEFQVLRATQCLLGAAPPWLLDPALGGLARLACLIDRRHARAARDFLGTAFPEESAAQIHGRVLAAYRHLARVAVESNRLGGVIGRKLSEHYEVEACEGLEELVASKKGCLVLTAHVGFWEGIGLPLQAMGYCSVAAVGKPPNNRYLARWVQERREEQGCVVLAREGAISGVSSTIRAGGVAVMLLDQRPRRKAIEVDFFGRPAECDRSAGVLVRRMATPLVVMGCYLTDRPGHYRLVFQRIVHPEEVKGASPEEVMQIVNRETEALVMRAPEQYLWLHDRFRGMPPLDQAEVASRTD